MPATKKRKKRQLEQRSITIKMPEEMFINIRDLANEEYRSISQQARMLLDLGFLHLIDATEDSECDEGAPEQEPCIGFKLDREEDYDDE